MLICSGKVSKLQNHVVDCGILWCCATVARCASPLHAQSNAVHFLKAAIAAPSCGNPWRYCAITVTTDYS